METIRPTRGRSMSHSSSAPDDHLFLSGLGRLRAHPVFAPAAWLVCLVLGGLFWLSVWYCMTVFY